jgi:hypothetical protein
MIRKWTTILAVVISCSTAVGEAGASPIATTNRDLWVAVQDPLFAGPTIGAFEAAAPPPANRTLTSNENMIHNEIGPAAGFSPEPGEMALLGAGVLGLYGVLRRRRNLMS